MNITRNPATSHPTTPTVERTHSPAGVRGRISALEGLRGLAVVGVLLFHDDRLSGGFLGVDLFFALSGFLITGLLIDEQRRNGAIALGRFWVRRARRLLPAMIVMLALIVPLMYWLGSPSQLKSARDGALPAMVYLSNWQQIGQGSDYWALFSDPSPMTHLWSLAVEGQFYIVWPLVFVAVSRLRHGRRWLCAVTVAGIAASVTAIVLLYDASNVNRAYIGTDTRVSAVLLGALVAILAMPAAVDRAALRRPTLTAAGTEVLHIALVAGLAWAWLSIDGKGSGLYRGGLLAHSAAATLLISTVGLQRPTIVQRLLSWRLLTALGAISYSLYLWHWPVYLILDEERIGTGGLGLSLLRWTVSVAAALASYWLVESPIRHRRWLTTRRTALVSIAASVAVIALLVVAVPRPDTTPAAFDPGSVVVPAFSTAPPATVPVDSVPTSNTPAVTTSTLAPRTITSVLWEGDSVAFDAAPGIVAALSAAGLDIQEFTFVGTGLVDPNADIQSLQVYGGPILELQPDVVIFQLSSWDAAHTVEDQKAAFIAFSDLVRANGAILVFVTPPPVDPTKFTSDIGYMRSLADALAAENPDEVIVLDSAELWGPFAYDTNGDGVPERKNDGVHVCPQGSALIGAWLLQQLDARFDGITPAPPAEWANGLWVNDGRYDSPLGACS